MVNKQVYVNITSIVDLVLKIVAIIALGVYIGWWG